MLHTVGHLLNLPHSPDPTNLMHDLQLVDDLDRMSAFTPEQVALMDTNLAREARDEVWRGSRWRFALRKIPANRVSIWRTVARANPLRLVLRLPTMLTAGFSLFIVVFFTAEIWDVASSLALPALILFSVISIVAASMVLYKAFAVRSGGARSGIIAESVVVAEAATLLSLLLTMIVLYLGFLLVGVGGALTFFPDALKQTWPSVEPAVELIHHVKLGMIVAAMGVLAGSLGGRAERKELIQRVLFLDEET
jgi:hypothetical protein